MAQMMVPAQWVEFGTSTLPAGELRVGVVAVAGYWRHEGQWYAHGTQSLQYDPQGAMRVYASPDDARRAIEQEFGVVTGGTPHPDDLRVVRGADSISGFSGGECHGASVGEGE